jgi:hypothetical protein
MISSLSIAISSGFVEVARIKDDGLWLEILELLIHKKIALEEPDFGGATRRCSIHLEVTDNHYDIAVGKEGVEQFIRETRCFSAKELHKNFPSMPVQQCVAKIGYLKRKMGRE